MFDSRKMGLVLALLASAFVTAPASAHFRHTCLRRLCDTHVAIIYINQCLPPNNGMSTITQQDLDTLKKQVAVLQGTLDDLKDQIAKLDARVTALENPPIPTPSTPQPSPPSGGTGSMPAQVTEVQSQLDQVRGKIDEIQKSSLVVNKTGRTNTPIKGPPVTAVPSDNRSSATGRIRLLNSYPVAVTVVLNGQKHQLAPNTYRILNEQPTGSIRYEVIGIQAPVNRVLRPNETLTVEVYPAG